MDFYQPLMLLAGHTYVTCILIYYSFKGTSLKKHPRNDIDEFDYSDTVENNELKKELMQRARMAGSTLHYGLARVQVPDKY